jgi:hypothetical protein
MTSQSLRKRLAALEAGAGGVAVNYETKEQRDQRAELELAKMATMTDEQFEAALDAISKPSGGITQVQACAAFRAARRCSADQRATR